MCPHLDVRVFSQASFMPSSQDCVVYQIFSALIKARSWLEVKEALDLVVHLPWDTQNLCQLAGDQKKRDERVEGKLFGFPFAYQAVTEFVAAHLAGH